MLASQAKIISLGASMAPASLLPYVTLAAKHWLSLIGSAAESGKTSAVCGFTMIPGSVRAETEADRASLISLFAGLGYRVSIIECKYSSNTAHVSWEHAQ